MKEALSQFHSNIERTRTLIAIHNSVEASTTKVLDTSDMLRSAIVMAVSALDHYVHEVVRFGMLEISRRQRPTTDAFLKFDVSLESVRQMSVDPLDELWLENEIRRRHNWQSFESPDRIADAIRLISDTKLWDVVAVKLGHSSVGVKKELSVVIDRRNKIAHEADVDPSFPGTRWPIDDRMVIDVVTFIEQVGNGIHHALTSQTP
ncbi:MAG: hypothetical protein HW388_731 [Dehalococcoidia bacterium]|nr:hypothetical protein [Dehalococcoidia bacterium]